MRAWIRPFILFVLCVIVEFGFFSFLPWVFPFLPLTFAFAVYRAHTFRVASGTVFLVLLGLWIEWTQLSGFENELISYTAAGLVLAISCRQLFAVRSFYGALGSASLSMLTLFALRAMFLLGPWIQHPLRADWGWFLRETLVTGLLLILLVSFFYVVRSVSGSVRRPLR